MQLINKSKELHGTVLNKATACFDDVPLLPQPLVEWYIEQHPEYLTQVQLILLRDYDIDDSVNKLLDKLLDHPDVESNGRSSRC